MTGTDDPAPERANTPAGPAAEPRTAEPGGGPVTPLDDGPVYEARFGFTPKGVVLIVFSVAFVVLAVVFPEFPHRVATIVFMSVAAVAMTAICLSGWLGLRVDRTGVTLGRPMTRYRDTDGGVPWDDIAAVVLYTQRLPSGTQQSYIAVRRHPHAATDLYWVSRAVSRVAIPGVAPELVAASRAIVAWRLDHDRLTAAVGHWAPHVPVLDHRRVSRWGTAARFFLGRRR
ncbi:hypothetical protein BJY24_005743 [Nocardia transvalensis]|uniref:Uncharacterized protein n=1 Tax=Nocardia transvalensis TaxID=37333 RepID=A0A7W9UKT5_9NOCA|nr:hypothetical protein [Nocardia transvalensis]MBB5916831.1 hypothetical protein [Nocardia transvalensis]